MHKVHAAHLGGVPDGPECILATRLRTALPTSHCSCSSVATRDECCVAVQLKAAAATTAAAAVCAWQAAEAACGALWRFAHQLGHEPCCMAICLHNSLVWNICQIVGTAFGARALGCSSNVLGRESRVWVCAVGWAVWRCVEVGLWGWWRVTVESFCVPSQNAPGRGACTQGMRSCLRLRLKYRPSRKPTRLPITLLVLPLQGGDTSKKLAMCF